MYSKHRIVEITADFEIEPIIDDYLKKYPNEDYAGYKVLFKVQDEHDVGEFSYLILLSKSVPRAEKTLSFYEFLKSYCTYENRRAVIGDRHLPRIGDGHTFGTPKPVLPRPKSKRQLNSEEQQT